MVLCVAPIAYGVLMTLLSLVLWLCLATLLLVTQQHLPLFRGYAIISFISVGF